MKGESGGWAFGLHALGSSNTNHGGFGFLGGNDAFSYYYIGETYNSATNFRFYKSGQLNIGGTTVIDTSRNATFVDLSAQQANLDTTSAPDFAAGSTTLRLNRAGGPNAGDYGNGITFAQYYWTGATTRIRTAGIYGKKTIGNGSFGGGLEIWTQPNGGANMSVALSIDHDQAATFAGSISSGRISPTGIAMSVDTGLYATDATLSYYSSTNGVYLNGAGSNGWLRLNAAGSQNDVNAINIFGSNAGANISFKTAGTQRMNIDSGGNLRWGASNTVFLDPSLNLTNVGTIFSADHRITSGTSGSNTSGLVFKTTDNPDVQKYIKQTAYYLQYNGNNNEGHHFTAGGTNSLLRLHGSSNGTRPSSVDITADNGLYMNNIQVMNASRLLQNVNLQGNAAGARRVTQQWHEDSNGQKRFYFEQTGRTFFGSGGGYIFRDSADAGRATISNNGGVNLLSGGDGLVGSTVALAVSGNTVIDSSRNLSVSNCNPITDNAYDLGTTSLRWRNLYTTDLHLSNEGKPEGNEVDGTTGNWTIQEGDENLYILNNKTGKKYKFALEEIT